MKAKTTERIELDMNELEAVLERARRALSEDDYKKLKAAVETLAFLTNKLEDKRTSINRLRRLLFGPTSEKTAKVCPEEGQAKAPATAGTSRGEETATADSQKEKRKGHGRNGAVAYHGAERIPVPHESLKAGDRCPKCPKGKVYELPEPAVLVRVVGQPPLGAKVWELQRLRCNLCGEVFTAKSPEGVGEEKYDARSASMIALLKYGSGLPFNRLERLEGNLGIPLPAATQWEIVERAARSLTPVYEEHIRQGAQGQVLHNDDTGMKILEFMGKRLKRRAEEEEGSSERTGIFTSGIVSTAEGRKIALFFTGRKHAGENLEDVLRERASELGPPIQMCDALSRNTPGDFEVVLANCTAHARRQFVDVAENFPEECRYVLETLRAVYRNDAVAKEQNLSAEQRLSFHQASSRPLMEDLRNWFTEQFEHRKVEPNSGLGQAISYMLNHWEKLTLFLREPGAPLDNSVCERALKKAIINRKNAYFYKTQHGARVGDLYMSLIHTSELCGQNPFDYLTELQRHAEALAENPGDWMPWNYQETLRASKGD